MYVIVVTENDYYSYTIVAKTEEELTQKWIEDQKRFMRWRKAWGVQIPIKKTYHYYGKPTSTLTI